MDKIIYVEQLSRNGRVIQRDRIDRFPATIGAAYCNDVIVDDRYVASCEARIELDEQCRLILADNGSVNGIVKRGSKGLMTNMLLSSGDQIRIGHSDIRIMFPDHPVHDPVVIKAGLFDLFLVANTPVFLRSLFFVTFISLMMSTYLSEGGVFSTSEWLISSAALVIMSLMIAGAWATGTRLVSHEFRFMQHLMVLSVMLLLVEVIEITMAYIYFIYSPDNRLDDVVMLLYSAAAILWFFIHLCVVSRQAMARKFLASFLIVGIVVGMVQLQLGVDAGGDIGELEFSSQIRAHGQSTISFVTVNQLFEEAEGLKILLDNDVKK
ncbi:MAG: FHA domain-containing protein [Gammaproteobacteria bacterium]|nr:FHA domain-containing protein [Gammaproteobacteria bacterium]